MPLIEHTLKDIEPEPTARGPDAARRHAIKQIERRRRFHSEAVASVVGLILLTIIWATSEYHSTDGCPTHGFSESSGIHEVWNYWIIYPIIVVILVLAARAWGVYGRKPISESEIRHEIERQQGTH